MKHKHVRILVPNDDKVYFTSPMNATECTQFESIIKNSPLKKATLNRIDCDGGQACYERRRGMDHTTVKNLIKQCCGSRK